MRKVNNVIAYLTKNGNFFVKNEEGEVGFFNPQGKAIRPAYEGEWAGITPKMGQVFPTGIKFDFEGLTQEEPFEFGTELAKFCLRKYMMGQNPLSIIRGRNPNWSTGFRFSGSYGSFIKEGEDNFLGCSVSQNDTGDITHVEIQMKKEWTSFGDWNFSDEELKEIDFINQKNQLKANENFIAFKTPIQEELVGKKPEEILALLLKDIIQPALLPSVAKKVTEEIQKIKVLGGEEEYHSFQDLDFLFAHRVVQKEILLNEEDRNSYYHDADTLFFSIDRWIDPVTGELSKKRSGTELLLELTISSRESSRGSQFLYNKEIAVKTLK